MPGTGAPGWAAAAPLGLGAGVAGGSCRAMTGACSGTEGRTAGACAKAGCAAIAAAEERRNQEVARVPNGTFNPFILNEYPKSSTILHRFGTRRQSRRGNSG